MNLLKKFSLFSIGPVVSALLGFITVPIITYYIVPAEYGRANMFTLLQSIFSMFMYLGMDQAYVREYFAVDKDQRKNLLANAMFVPILLIPLMEILLFVFRYDLSYWLFESYDELFSIYLLMALLPMMVFENFALLRIRLAEKGLLYSTLIIALKLLILIFTVGFFLFYEKSFRSVIYALAFAEILIGLILLLTVIRREQLFKQRLDKDLIGQMLRYGLPLLPASLMIWILNSMDKIMLRELYDYHSVGIYSVAFKFVTILAIIQTCFRLFWTPVANRWHEEGKDRASFELVGKILTILMFIVFIGLLLVKDLVIIIFSQKYMAAAQVVPFLLIYPIMCTISEVTFLGINFSRKTTALLVTTTVAALVNGLLNYTLIPPYAAMGAAVATGISYLVYFWTGSLISRKLWYDFPLKLHLLTSGLILLNGLVHIIWDNYLPYGISVLSLILYLACYRKFIFDRLTLAWQAFRKGASKR